MLKMKPLFPNRPWSKVRAELKDEEKMKQLLITIFAVVLVGVDRVAELSLIEAARKGNIEAVKNHIANGKQDFFNKIDVNAADVLDKTALHYAAASSQKSPNY